jgi:hypothetical protein
MHRPTAVLPGAELSVLVTRSWTISSWTQIYRRNKNLHEKKPVWPVLFVSANISKSFCGRFCLFNIIDVSLSRSVVKFPCWAWLHKQNRCELYSRSTSLGYKYNTVFAGSNPLPQLILNPQPSSVILAFTVLPVSHGHKTKASIIQLHITSIKTNLRIAVPTVSMCPGPGMKPREHKPCPSEHRACENQAED